MNVIPPEVMKDGMSGSDEMSGSSNNFPPNKAELSKPISVKSETLGAKPEDKDEDEIIKDEIVQKTTGILNELKPENFDRMVTEFLGLKLEDKDDRFAAVMNVVFEKAIDEPNFTTACASLIQTICDRSLTGKKFRKNILDLCEKEFQKGTTQEEIKDLEEKLAIAIDHKKGELKLELAGKKFASRSRIVGNVRFIGELYELRMLTPKIMIDYLTIMLENHDEVSLESLCTLLTTIGQRLENQLKELEAEAAVALRSNPPTPIKSNPPEKYMENTFESLRILSQDMKLSLRIRLALLDLIELREFDWDPSRVADGPKRIEKVQSNASTSKEAYSIPPMGKQYMGRFTPLAVPPPQPFKRPPPKRGTFTEDKDDDEIIKDEIVRKTKRILNGISPENFDKKLVEFFGLNIDNKDDRIAAVVFVIFETAIDDPGCSTACASLIKAVCDESQFSAKKFRKNILDQCQKEFQKGSTAEEEIKALEELLPTVEEGKKEELKLELADKKYASSRRSLSNVRFIGELYKLQMLTPKIMIDCVNILLLNHDEDSFESLCTLLMTIGQRLENQLKELELKAALALRSNPPTPVKFNPPEKYIAKTFESLRVLSQDMRLSSRIRLTLLDVIELWECSWNPSRDDDAKIHGEVSEKSVSIQDLPLNRLGPNGGRNRRTGPPGTQYMERSYNALPPPPHYNRPPARVIELSREEVKLHKAEHPWKPTPVRYKTRRAKIEDKDDELIIMDDIVKKTRGILNKLTPENFDKLVIAFLGLQLEDKDDRIVTVVHLIFEKAINEPGFSYGNLAIDEPSYSCAYANMVKTVCDKSQPSAQKFRKNILNQCQKEFQKGSTAEKEINALEEQLVSAEEEKKELKLELAQKKYVSRRRRLGNVRFMGELYKLQMLTPQIMIDCVNILLRNHDEVSLESLCTLITTIGQRLDNQLKELEVKAALALRSNPPTPVKFSPPEKYMNKTFENLRILSQDMKISSRIRCFLLDVIELRERSWKPRRDILGPMKIGEVHRHAIRQQQEERIQLQNLPPQGPPMRPGSMPQKKINDWSTVPSNKASRFLVKKPTGMSSRQESSPMFAPNRGGSWNSPGGGGQLPPRSNQFIPPRLQTQQSHGRFGVLSPEDRAPPPTPLRENIVQAPLPPLRTQGSRESSRPQTPTGDQVPPMRPEPIQTLTPSKDVSVKNVFQEFMSTSNLEDVAYYIKQSFPGDKVVDFVDQLSKQVCDMSMKTQEKGAGALVKGLIKINLITQAQVIKVFTEGLMIDLPDIEAHVPKVTSYLGVFLVELFQDEPNLSWLVTLGESLKEQEPTVWANLVTNTLNFLKLRLSEEAVQILYKKTENANRLPVDDLPWIAGESVETLSKKMLLVLEKEKDSANISDSFKENSWDLREELTSKSLTEAICQFSWKAAGGWDVPVLQKLLPQLMIAHPRLHPQLWNQAKEFIKRNSIRTEEEEELWEEMYKLKLMSRESFGHPSY